jgi:hypothetical protein
MLIMNGFLDAFLPNLAATILGLVLGLPIALFINGRLTAAQRRHEKASEIILRNLVIDVLSASCEYNIKVLRKIAELALTANVLRNPDLKTTAWDSVGSVLAARCPDPELIHQLAHHWIRLRRLEQLNEELFKLTVGMLPELEDAKVQDDMWQELHDTSTTLALHATDFSERLVKLKAS